MKVGNLVCLRQNFPASVYTHERGLTETILTKGTSGVIISIEIRGPVPGAKVMFNEDKTIVTWCPTEFLKVT